jgi:hypothetical protein
MVALDRKFPFDNASFAESEWREMHSAWVPDGIVATVGTQANVTAGVGMTTNVGPGAATIRGHYAAWDTTKTVAFAAAHPTLPRRDRIVARLNTIANDMTIEVLTGTAAASPVVPALTQNAAVWELALATIDVAAAATSVAVAVDERTLFGAGPAKQADILHNGDFTVWQRGAGWLFGGKTYTADRWVVYRGSSVAGGLANRVAGPPLSQYGLRVQRDAGNTNTSLISLYQQVESADASKYAGKTVTVQFQARAGANYSSAANVLTVQLISGAGIDQDLFAGWTTQTNSAITNVTLTASWQTFTTQIVIPAIASEWMVYYSYAPAGTAGAADYFEIADVSIVDSPTPVKPARRSYAQELAICQRFFTMAPSGDYVWIGQAYAAAAAALYYVLPVPMRAIPTLTIPAGPYTGWLSETGISTRTPTGLASGSNSVRVAGIGATGVTGLSLYAPVAANASFAPIPISADL